MDLPVTRGDHGGARKGAGRKPGVHTVRMTFTITIGAAAALKKFKGNKSRFVSDAILKAIKAS
jgi:hypothetical protein